MSDYPGVKVDDWCDEWIAYEGKQDSLIDTGLFCLAWFPGQPGNGKGSSVFVFTDETRRNGYIKKPGDKKPRENGYGRVTIATTGAAKDPKYRVWLHYSPADAERRKLQRETCTGSDEWQLAKEARTDKGEVFARWRNAISYRIDELENLCAGKAYFSEMPDVRIQGVDLARVSDAVATLRRAFALSKPSMPDVVIRSNVYSIRDGVHRGLKKTG